MKQKYTELLPLWWDEKERHDLVLSNDIDSLASCMLLQKELGWKIRYFYDFENVYASEFLKFMKYERCWVDVAIREGHAIDNHVSALSRWDSWNQEMINLNVMENVNNDYYTSKYSGSTLLEVWSLLDYPLPKTEEGKMLLLAIDTTFKGFYDEDYHDTQKYYLVDVLGFDELYKVIKRHKKFEFYNLIKKYGLNKEIFCIDNKVCSTLNLSVIGNLLGIELELPTDKFFIWKELEVIEAEVSDYYHVATDVSNRLYSLALTFHNQMRYSKLKMKEEDIVRPAWYKWFAS